MLKSLLKVLPVHYHKAVESFEREDGLIDDCKYMLYLRENYASETSFPCRTIKEAVEFTKDFTYIAMVKQR
jgi:hypothetical protein